jgi:hypothetical protein
MLEGKIKKVAQTPPKFDATQQNKFMHDVNKYTEE